MRIAVHQANFIPWVPYFYKMARCDVFVLYDTVQFEKNGFQNRFMYKGKWITKPVKGGTCLIKDKQYADGQKLAQVNRRWIEAIRDTLNIKALLISYPWVEKASPTLKLVGVLKYVHRVMGKSFDPGITYVTNPSAKEKYLDEELMRKYLIDIEYCDCPSHLKVSMFEAFESIGIDSLSKQLNVKEKELCESAS